MKRRVRLVWFALAAGIALIAGFAQSGCFTRTASKPREESTIKVLGLLYGQYMGQHMGKAPPSEQAFREFVQKQTAFLQQFHVENVDELFRSARDGEPYTVVYGDLSQAGQLLGAPVIAWEKKGVNGRRYVVNTLGSVKEVTDEEFAKLGRPS
ncbi:hypothetical protein THTE_0102 [Thermogutta terrifontis]|uniref:Uncharacterized protein n=1 Tax=Thermogutta terrifontis TaxID=1331910 RepID=A0A286R9R0_9BACT|nr:hypothetical protein [Thermogutta terrifontis]ASV72704.1 hypothetical protein THTE_0102 [Thermogutta terrifontis]